MLFNAYGINIYAIYMYFFRLMCLCCRRPCMRGCTVSVHSSRPTIIALNAKGFDDNRSCNIITYILYKGKHSTSDITNIMILLCIQESK